MVNAPNQPQPAKPQIIKRSYCGYALGIAATVTLVAGAVGVWAYNNYLAKKANAPSYQTTKSDARKAEAKDYDKIIDALAKQFNTYVYTNETNRAAETQKVEEIFKGLKDMKAIETKNIDIQKEDQKFRRWIQGYLDGVEEKLNSLTDSGVRPSKGVDTIPKTYPKDENGAIILRDESATGKEYATDETSARKERIREAMKKAYHEGDEDGVRRLIELLKTQE